jgi:RNA polymerase sigma factor (sigma-70 family)
MIANFNRNEEDQRLAIAVKRRDQQSLGLLYDKYAPALMGIISRIVNNHEIAEEVLRTTFLKLWDQIGSFDASKSSFFSWLINLARRTAQDEWKSTQFKNPPPVDTVYKQGSMGDADRSFEEITQDAAFDLVYYRGLSCDEAAARLNISVESLRTNMRAAIQNLKTLHAI